MSFVLNKIDFNYDVILFSDKALNIYIAKNRVAKMAKGQITQNSYWTKKLGDRIVNRLMLKQTSKENKIFVYLRRISI